MTGDVALVGDWNIAPQDEDVFDIARFAKSTHVTPSERAAFNGFLEDGYVDVVRPHAPARGIHLLGLLPAALRAQPWDAPRLRPGQPGFAERVTGAFIDREERAGKGASDHAPVIVDLD